jgi:5-methylcytosine-specific restriction endonuclease McrA
MPIRPENRSRYPENWATISDWVRFSRALGRCECEGECGTAHPARCEAVNRQRSPYTGSLVVLTVAHLDHAPENCDRANLKAMCQRCHLAYDREHHKQTAAATRKAAIEASGQEALL